MIDWPINIVQNKYNKWYNELIVNATNRTLPEGIYTENHHIIPYCMTRNNKKSNIVSLTAREHFIAHLLLWKITMPKKWHNKMTMALHMMVNGSGYGKQKLARSKYIVPSRLVEKHRLEWREHISNSMKGEKNPFYGKKHSEKTKALIKQRNAETKDIRSEKLMGENNGMYGQAHTEEVKAVISKKSKEYWGDSNIREEQSERVRQQWQDPKYKEKQRLKRLERWAKMSKEERSAIGKKAASTKKANSFKLSDETKRKMSESRKKAIAEGRIVPWNKGKKIGIIQTCVHCGKTCARHNYSRWHGDNCKQRVEK